MEGLSLSLLRCVVWQDREARMDSIPGVSQNAVHIGPLPVTVLTHWVGLPWLTPSRLYYNSAEDRSTSLVGFHYVVVVVMGCWSLTVLSAMTTAVASLPLQ